MDHGSTKAAACGTRNSMKRGKQQEVRPVIELNLELCIQQSAAWRTASGLQITKSKAVCGFRVD